MVSTSCQCAHTSPNDIGFPQNKFSFAHRHIILFNVYIGLLNIIGKFNFEVRHRPTFNFFSILFTRSVIFADIIKETNASDKVREKHYICSLNIYLNFIINVILPKQFSDLRPTNFNDYCFTTCIITIMSRI